MKGGMNVQCFAAAFKISRRARFISYQKGGLPNGTPKLSMTSVLADALPQEDPISLNINGRTYSVQAPGDMPLLWVLRDLLNLKGTKFGCGIAQCGACTVHVDGRPVRSCMLPAANVGSREVTTIEAIGQKQSGRRIQQAWLELEVVQCGYCQSGQIMSAAALIERNPSPDDAEIDAAMAGNICRCATYARIRAAIKSASRT
jgi:isoquinoline 1-oxidoreductase subunit alpha